MLVIQEERESPRVRRRDSGKPRRQHRKNSSSPKSRADWKPSVLAPLPSGPVHNIQSGSLFHFCPLSFKEQRSTDEPRKKGRYWNNPCVSQHNLEPECHQEVRWLKQLAIPPVPGSQYPQRPCFSLHIGSLTLPQLTFYLLLHGYCFLIAELTYRPSWSLQPQRLCHSVCQRSACQVYVCSHIRLYQERYYYNYIT